MIGSRRLGLLVLLGGAACRRDASHEQVDPPPVRIPDDAAAPDAGALGRSPGVALVVTLDGQAYVPLEDWLLPAGAPAFSAAWGDGPLIVIGPKDPSQHFKLQAATAAPPAWTAAIGAAVPAYAADGTPCPTTITALFLLGYGSGNGDDLGDDEPYLVGRLAPTPGCTPVLATDRAAPDVFAPAATPPPAAERSLAAAFRRLPAYRRLARANGWDAAPEVRLFASRGGELRALVTTETHELDDNCTSRDGALRAIFTVGTPDAPKLLAETEAELGGAPVALLDSDRDGHLELVVGAFFFDHGQSATTSLAHYWDSADPDDNRADAPVTDVHFDYYAGCD